VTTCIFEPTKIDLITYLLVVTVDRNEVMKNTITNEKTFTRLITTRLQFTEAEKFKKSVPSADENIQDTQIQLLQY